MYETHPSFVAPENENAKIWRYVDFAKLVSLVDRSSLFFVKASKLEDPYEGSVPTYNRIQRQAAYAEVRAKFPTEGAFGKFLDSLGKLNDLYTTLKESVLVNCWYLSEFESAVMWKAYSDENKGVAIQSTFRRLRDSFHGNSRDRVWIGRVRYLDYETEWLPEGNVLDAFISKRKSFQAESELRAVIWQTDLLPRALQPLESSGSKSNGEGLVRDVERQESGKFVSVDVSELIERIYVSPKAEDWTVEVVKSIIEKYRLGKDVVKSSLYTLE